MISVCVATYNGVRFIKQQMDSILSQLSDDDELIISDDGSSDGTLEIIEAYNDTRIKVLNHTKKIQDGMYKNFRYATENFENALKYAHGDYIFLSDQDDIWMFGKVEKCLGLLEKCDCVVHNYQVIDENGKIRTKQYFHKNPLHKTVLGNVIDSHFRGCCMAFKKNLLKYVLPIPSKVIGHDYWIGALVTHYGKVFYEIEPLIQSRWYEGTVSAYRKTSIWYKLRFRNDLLLAVIQRIIRNK